MYMIHLCLRLPFGIFQRRRFSTWASHLTWFKFVYFSANVDDIRGIPLINYITGLSVGCYWSPIL